MTCQALINVPIISTLISAWCIIWSGDARLILDAGDIRILAQSDGTPAPLMAGVPSDNFINPTVS